jgi:RNase P subunit RPR2
VITGEMVAKRLDITLEKKIKRSYCKKCKSIYGADTKIRIKSHLVIVRCPHCGDIRRFPIS